MQLLYRVEVAQSERFNNAIANNELLAPAKTMAEMHTVALSNQINAGLCAFFMIVAFVMLFASIKVVRRALADPNPSVNEAEAIYRDPEDIKAQAHH